MFAQILAVSDRLFSRLCKEMTASLADAQTMLEQLAFEKDVTEAAELIERIRVGN